MAYSYRRNKDGSLHLLTGEKAKEKDIVIKMGSIISEVHIVEAITRATYNLVWSLEEHTNDELLTLKGKIDGEIFNFDLNKEFIVRQFCKMVQDNLTLETCTYLTTMLEKCYNSIFLHFFNKKGYFFANNIPIESYAVIKSKGKILGAASRFSFNTSDILQLYEYTGKEITSDTEDINISIVIDDSHVKFRVNNNVDFVENREFNPEMHMLGYLGYKARIYGINDNDSIEVPEIAKLNNLPKSFTNVEEMNSYIRNNNSAEEITAYKISLKPKVEIIDINRFMLREFMV